MTLNRFSFAACLLLAGGLAACDGEDPIDTDPVEADTDTDTDSDTDADTDADTDSDTDTDTDVQVTFDDAHAVFQNKCGPCHVTGGSGGHNIGANNIDDAYADSQESSTGGTVGDFSLTRILNGSMPQAAGCTGDPATDAGNAACLDATDLAIIEDWIDAGQPR